MITIMASSTIALIIVGIALVCFVTNIIPISVTSVGAALAMAIFGVIPYSNAFAGFSNDVTIMVIGAMIIGEALFETGAAPKLGYLLLKIVKNNERAFLVGIVFIATVLSAFLSNVAVVAMMLPVAAAAAASSKGMITKKNTYMAIGISSMIGGGMTLVGSVPNVIGQAFLVNAGLEPMQFFDLTLVTLPRFVVFMLFFLTIGYSLSKKIFNFPEVENTKPTDNGKATGETVINPVKMWVSVGILIAMIAGFISQIWTIGTVALLAGLLCVLTRCISIKQVFSRLDWNTIWVLAGAIGFATGLDVSGAGALVANSVIALFGGTISFFTLIIVFTILGVLCANLMSATSAMTILTPIALFICIEMGYDAKAVVMTLVMALNLGFMTPISLPPMTMTLTGGYRFTDYTKFGGILTFFMLIVTFITLYFVYV